MHALFWLINEVLSLYLLVVLAAVILSWLIAFGVVNRFSNRLVANVDDALRALTEPALRPIRSVLPNLGGVDISPIILFLLVGFIQRLLLVDIEPYVVGPY
jgi:YggT family protein